MKTHSLTLCVAAIVGAFALFATPAEAGDCRKSRKHHHHGYHRGGWNDYGYYQPYYRPARYYQPARYVEAPIFYPPPAFQIGFVFGGNRNCR